MNLAMYGWVLQTTMRYRSAVMIVIAFLLSAATAAGAYFHFRETGQIRLEAEDFDLKGRWVTLGDVNFSGSRGIMTADGEAEASGQAAGEADGAPGEPESAPDPTGSAAGEAREDDPGTAAAAGPEAEPKDLPTVEKQA